MVAKVVFTGMPAVMYTQRRGVAYLDTSTMHCLESLKAERKSMLLVSSNTQLSAHSSMLHVM
jgi:hypothetical protein